MSVITWQVATASVRGASHIRQGLPNQDAVACAGAPSAAGLLVLAVADGHGSAKSFRSDRGSRFAVQVATAVIEASLNSAPLSDIQWMAEERFSKIIVREWRAAVERDAAAEPFTPEESALSPRPYLAYGSTLLTVAVTPDFMLVMQLGDGDVLLVGDDGAVQRPFEPVPRLIANETTSLCQDNAWRLFRCRVLPKRSFPVMVLAATDGYANAFRTEAGFLRVGSDLLTMIRSASLAAVSASLPDWLEDASAKGSGDDVTVGILYAMPASAPYRIPDKVKARPVFRREPLRRPATTFRTRDELEMKSVRSTRIVCELTQLLSKMEPEK